MRYLFASLVAVLAAFTAWAGDPPSAFRLEDVEITLQEQPRWPTGYAMKVTVQRGSVIVAKTALPCDPCVEKQERLAISDADLLGLLNTVRQSWFFDAAGEYSSTTQYAQGSDGVVRETQTVTTDDDRVIVRVRIAEWSKQVIDDGEAPPSIRALQNALFALARARRQQGGI